MAQKRTKAARPPTLRDVAAYAKVDPSVVSRVLNDDPRQTVTAETKERILAGVKKLGYTPNVMARGLRLARTWTIGLVLPDLTNPVYGQMVQGAQERAHSSGYEIVLGSSVGDEQAIEASFARLLSQGRVDGLLVASATAEDDVIRDVAAASAPVVVLNRRVEGVESSVIADDAAGARLATQHVIGLGHTRLGHIGGPARFDTSIRRREGFERAARDGNAQLAAVRAGTSYDSEAGYGAALELFRDHPDVTAVFAANVVIALGAIRAALESGRSIPADLSVVALHDMQLAAFTQPPLTTVALPLAEVGAAAVDLLLEKIDGKSGKARVIGTPPELVLRGSSAPPRRTR